LQVLAARAVDAAAAQAAADLAAAKREPPPLGRPAAPVPAVAAVRLPQAAVTALRVARALRSRVATAAKPGAVRARVGQRRISHRPQAVTEAEAKAVLPRA
jgi:hypothetical protein